MAFPKRSEEGVQAGKPKSIKIIKHNTRAKGLKSQPTPLHDYINFKKMQGNEIILNLDNHENLANSELVSGLMELGRRDKEKKFDWNAHPVTYRCLSDMRQRIPCLNSKNLLQTAILLDRLVILDRNLWTLTSTHVLRLLHKYKGRDMAVVLDLFDKDFLDDDGEPFIYIKKAQDEFFERIVSLLPMHINHMNEEQIVRTLEVLTKRNLGSERLFLHYLYLKIERSVFNFNVGQYCRVFRTLCDRRFVEDSVFWHDHIFKFVY